jgi:hypothetical protein
MARGMAQWIDGASRTDASRNSARRKRRLPSAIFREIRLGNPIRVSSDTIPWVRCQRKQCADHFEKTRANARKLQHADMGIRLAALRYIPSSRGQRHCIYATCSLKSFAPIALHASLVSHWFYSVSIDPSSQMGSTVSVGANPLEEPHSPDDNAHRRRSTA